MSNKRGQITLFVLVGIVILTVTALVFYLVSAPEEVGKQAMELQDFEERAESVKLFVEQCVDKTANDALWLFGAQGGRVLDPYDFVLELNESAPKPVLLAGYNIEMLQFGEMNLMKDTEILNKELEDYVSIALLDCFDNFTSFPGLDVEVGNIETDAIIHGDYVDFSVVSPVTIQSGEVSKTFDKFSRRANIRVGTILLEASNLINQGKFNPGMFDVSLISESEFNISVSDYNDKTFLYLISDSSSRLFGEPYKFLFAARYEI